MRTGGEEGTRKRMGASPCERGDGVTEGRGEGRTDGGRDRGTDGRTDEEGEGKEGRRQGEGERKRARGRVGGGGGTARLVEELEGVCLLELLLILRFIYL